MSNKDKYKQAFSVLHTSREISVQEASMNTNTAKRALRPAFVAAISVVAVFGCLGGAYAADLGGIQEQIRVWFGGEAVQATIVQDPESATGAYSVYLENGEKVGGGGGVAIEADGTERPITVDEVADQFNNYVDRSEDGTIWLYYGGTSYNITDIMVDGACNVVIQGEDGNPIYYEIEDNNGGGYAYTASPEPNLPVEEYVEL